MALGFFKLNNININFIIDKNVENILSYRVYKPNKLNDLDLNTNLCICNSKKDFFIIYNKLKLIGFKNVYHFYEYTEIFKKKFYLSNGWYLKKKNNLNFYIKSLKKIFEDDISENFYKNFILWHANRDYLNNFIPDKNKYFNNLTSKFFQKRNTKYLDIGTGYGRSLNNILKKNKHLDTICIDGCGKVAKYLKSKYKSKSTIKVLKKVISNKKKLIKFHDGLYHISKISPSGKKDISSSLDDLKLNPSIIKVHTEGEELNVLKGSIKTIKKNTPLLMINVYHNTDGIIKIFNFLKKFKKNYKFYLRGYSYVGTNYILYCVPKN